MIRRTYTNLYQKAMLSQQRGGRIHLGGTNDGGEDWVGIENHYHPQNGSVFSKDTYSYGGTSI
jgi:hypothetical protein